MRIFTPSHTKRKLFFIVVDILIFFSAALLAFELRFDFQLEARFIPSLWFTFVALATMRIASFHLFNMYDISWRHFSFRDMAKAVNIMIFTTLLFLILVYIVRMSDELVFPRSIIPIEFFISLFLLLAMRVSKRMFLERYKKKALGKHTLIVAFADQANSIIRTLNSSDQNSFPVAIVDDSNDRMKIGGVEVYSWERFLAQGPDCEQAIVDKSMPLSTFYSKLKTAKIKEIKIAENYSDAKADLHAITVEDLLARHPKDLDKSTIASFIENKTVLITGAGGSIGSEIARQCVFYKAKQVILLDHSEINLYTISQELENYDCVSVMQNVTNSSDIEKTFDHYRPQIVIHAAAYKHVPLVEENIHEAIVNNVLGTKTIIDKAIEHKVEKFILISTDKAVRPTNVMGTTKRICELYAQNVPFQNTEIVAVRFGNVLGSSGSVIPKFKQQIEQGGPITVTHPDITRYFMLIPEACELVLQAGAIGKGGEIFILDMGEPVKIVDLALKVIELSGSNTIEIVFSGLRPGEKLYEELLIDESDAKTAYESITVAKSTHYEYTELNNDIMQLLKCDEPLKMLKKIVPEFDHKVNA